MHHADLTDAAALAPVFAASKYDAVIHFAAKSLVGESTQRPFDYFRHNLGSTLNLLDFMQRHEVKRIVFSSTANIFGATGNGPIDENEVVSPGSPYGESKHMIERMLGWCRRIHGFQYAALRYFNAAGADPDGQIGEEHKPETHLVPLVLQTALGKRKNITVFGNDYDTPDGTCIRDYVHVCDLAQAHLLALERTRTGSIACNLGTGQGYSVLEVIEAARRITGKDIPVETGPRRSGDPATLVADPGLACRELGWKMEYSDLETILKTAWAWHSSRP